MKKTFTKAQKDQYFKSLREQWNEAKKHASNGGKAEYEAMVATHGFNISATGYMLVSMQMKSQGLNGIPYLDAKTFHGWKENGFKVRKGEKSTISGITWIGIATNSKDEEDETKTGYAMPKAYHLFHRSQVDAI